MKPRLFRLALALTTSTCSPLLAQSGSVPGQPTALESMLMAQERETWEAVKRQDAAAFASLCLDDGYEIFGDGTLVTFKEVMAQIPDTRILDYTITDIRVILVSRDTALVRYRVYATTSYKGVITPPRWMLATAVWVQTPNGWKAAMYQETPQVEATPGAPSISAPNSLSMADP